MMECTTGLTDDEFDELLAWLREEGVEGYPPILGLSGSLTAALMYIRQNIVQAVIGERLGVSQPTISRAIKALTEALSRTLVVLLLTAEEVPRDCDYVVDGTLFPCLDWHGHRDLWSVKHKRAGMNVQILVRPDGRFVWASDPYPGSMHDVAAPGAFRTAGGNGPLRVDRRQGIRGKRDDHPAQEAPQRRTERSRPRGQQEHQPDPPGRKSAPSPTSRPGESSTPTTAAPWKHSSRPSPQHSHFMPSRPPPE